mmetsp:Transcript_18832/g.27902  ORF Transcript_18832/g.27902 Transcript_18832/m.27902 type:complete len:97 (+) Transcript_18832:487-777(+)
METLMGFDEMYSDPPPEDLASRLAATYWGKKMQPAAIATSNLVLISPTLNDKNTPGTKGFADFLKECYDLYDPIVKIDVTLISSKRSHFISAIAGN